MKQEKTYSHYTDFLQDDDFILWQLTQDDSLSQPWIEYLQQHPDVEAQFQEAVSRVGKVRFMGEKLNEEERAALLDTIKESSQVLVRKKRIHLFARYAAAACVLLIISFALLYKSDILIPDDISTHSVIAGYEMQKQDIQLTTASGTTSFDENLDLYINPQGDVVVTQKETDSLLIMKTTQEVNNRLEVPYGKQSRITLADGSKVWLNSGSVLEFPAQFNGQERNISISGEMYIEVSKDEKKPFFVHTKGLDIKVYGTAFNVSAYDNLSESVVLVEGRVGVKTMKQTEIHLLPNERLLYSNNKLTKEAVDVSQYISWKDGYLIFNNTPMKDVLQQMEKYYNVSFNLADNVNLSARTCTGKIYLSPHLSDVLNTVSVLSSTTYTIKDKIIYINLETNNDAP